MTCDQCGKEIKSNEAYISKDGKTKHLFCGELATIRAERDAYYETCKKLTSSIEALFSANVKLIELYRRNK